MRIIVARSAVFVAFTATSGCVQHEPDRPSPPPVPSLPAAPAPPAAPSPVCNDMHPQLQAKDIGCGSPHCGGNSPVINQFPINGLHSGGCKNLQGLSLDRGSFRSAPKKTCLGTDLTLVARNDGLVATDSHDQEVCSGQELVGGVFSITFQAEGAPTQRLLVKIADLAMIPLAGGVESIPAYLFTTVETNAPLCRAEVGVAWQHSQPTSSLAPTTEPSLADYAVIMTNGDVYDEKGQPIPEGKNGWFNIACADDALAKLRLYGMDRKTRTLSGERLRPAGLTDYEIEIGPYFDPLADPLSAEGQHAALNMLTANYCGTAEHYTRHGIKIGWPTKPGTPALKPKQSAPKSSASDHPMCSNQKSNPKSLEALWGKSGAVCVCRSRLWLTDTLIPSDRLPGSCKNGRCGEQTFLDQAAACPQPVPRCNSLPKNHDLIFWESDLEDHLLKIQ
jgi:ADYC domain-containing protein